MNLFTITKYSGLDPELGGDDRAFGSDTGNYPNVKQFIFGINLVSIIVNILNMKKNHNFIDHNPCCDSE